MTGDASMSVTLQDLHLYCTKTLSELHICACVHSSALYAPVCTQYEWICVHVFVSGQVLSCMTLCLLGLEEPRGISAENNFFK